MRLGCMLLQVQVYTWDYSTTPLLLYGYMTHRELGVARCKKTMVSFLHRAKRSDNQVVT